MRADAELADQRFGDMTPVDMGDFMREDAGERIGIGLGDRRLEHDDIAAGKRRGVEHRYVERGDLDPVRALGRARRNALDQRFERALAIGVAATQVPKSPTIAPPTLRSQLIGTCGAIQLGAR